MGNENQGKSTIEAEYYETDTQRVLEFRSTDKTAIITQNRTGYAMVKVHDGKNSDELERYYGFDMALDHVAELLGVSISQLPIPDSAEDMGM